MKYLITDFTIEIANAGHRGLAEDICAEMEKSAKARGTGIAKRSPDYIKAKMLEGKAVVATYKDGSFAGFCYIESWGHQKYVANSGLIISPNYRGVGLAKEIKKKAFELSRLKFPEAKLFGLTTSLAVMKINSELGYKPVTFSELTDDKQFWKGCQSCVNYDILTRTEQKHCLCTGMLYDPEKDSKTDDSSNVGKEDKPTWNKRWAVYSRWLRIKKNILTKISGLGLNNKKLAA